MNWKLEPGTYVIAVSGGVDSVVLLNMLSMQPDLRLVVAHFDHGIREDSLQDRHFVDGLAKEYHLPFVYAEGRLGSLASEATAREARYNFLHTVRKSANARTIITAHHEDDLLETVFINVLRGTGRKGLSSLGSSEHLQRPLLGMSKKAITDYAKAHKLTWREDSTNQDLRYLRNYLRHKVLPKITTAQRQRLLQLAHEALTRNKIIDNLLINHLHMQPSSEVIERHWFSMLPHNVAREVLGHWLRLNGISFDAKAIERLVVGMKTLPAGSSISVNQGWLLKISKTEIRMHRPQSV
jgi:tRNA(Ile)-lysidine synthetase-like protein